MRATRKKPDYAEAWTMLGTVQKQQNKTTEALASLKEAIRLDDESPGPYTLIGQILRSQDDMEGSRKAFADAARLKAKKEAEQKDHVRPVANGSRRRQNRYDDAVTARPDSLLELGSRSRLHARPIGVRGRSLGRAVLKRRTGRQA